MSSVECFRGFINERLTVAAEEIFGVFEKAMVEYEEEIDRQSRLLDVVWKPAIKLHRIEPHVSQEEEVLSVQQLCIQERSSSLDQEDPEPPQSKEEQEEQTSQEGEQLEMKQETETFMLTPTCEEMDHSEDETLNLCTDETQRVAQETPLGYISVESAAVPEPNKDHEAERQDQKGGKHGDSESTKNAEPKLKPYLCNTCGKRFKRTSTLNTHMRTHTELPQQHVCKEEEEEEEEVLSEQQLCIQERSSSLDQEDPEPPQIKEEQEELCTSQEGEQLELKQETETFMLTSTYEESDHSEPEPTSDHQLLSYISHVAESPDQKGSEAENSQSTRNAEPKNQHQQSRNRVNKVHNPEIATLNRISGSDNGWMDNPEMSIDYNTHTDKKTVQCAMCNKTFKFKSRLRRHLIVHTGERLHFNKSLTCDICGKAFVNQSSLLMHLRTHSGEKPYSCNTCGKRFSQKSSLKSHIRIHTGEKPYSCKTCGKRFTQTSALSTHVTIHTGEKPHSCKICGKDFRLSGDLTVHMRIHTGEKPFTCLLCGKLFRYSSDLAVHRRRPHSGLKP